MTSVWSRDRDTGDMSEYAPLPDAVYVKDIRKTWISWKLSLYHWGPNQLLHDYDTD